MTEPARTGLAVFGGAFNPPHLTHRKIIAAAKEQLPVQQVLVLPAGDHPHKQDTDSNLAPPAARLELCHLAFGDLPYVTIDDRELCREGLSYTVDTLRELHGEHPDTTLYFLLGSDNLPVLHTWRDPAGILELATLVTYPRKGHEVTAEALANLELAPEQQAHLLQHVLDVTPNSVAATAIRDAIREGRAPDDVERQVFERIRQLGLYGT